MSEIEHGFWVWRLADGKSPTNERTLIEVAAMTQQGGASKAADEFLREDNVPEGTILIVVPDERYPTQIYAFTARRKTVTVAEKGVMFHGRS